MLKKSTLIVLTSLIMTACSQQPKDEQPQNASQPAPTASVTTETASITASVATSSENVASVAASATQTTNVNLNDPKIITLRKDLTVLVKTLNQLNKEAFEKQEALSHQMRSAKTPEEHVKFYKEGISQMNHQKAELGKLKFTDKRVSDARDAFVNSITLSLESTNILIKEPKTTAENNQEFAQKMQGSQQAAMEAQKMMIALMTEAGAQTIEKTASAPQAASTAK